MRRPGPARTQKPGPLPLRLQCCFSFARSPSFGAGTRQIMVRFVFTRYFAANLRISSARHAVISSGMELTRSALPSNSTACESDEARRMGISSSAYQSERILARMRSSSAASGPVRARSRSRHRKPNQASPSSFGRRHYERNQQRRPVVLERIAQRPVHAAVHGNGLLFLFHQGSDRGARPGRCAVISPATAATTASCEPRGGMR